MSTFNYPRLEELTRKTAFFLNHPLAMFNLNSRFFQFRMRLDHEAIFQRYFEMLRLAQMSPEEIENEIATDLGGVDKVIRTAEIEEWTRQVREVKADLSMAHAAGTGKLVIDPLRPDATDKTLDIEFFTPSTALKKGRATFSAQGKGLKRGRLAMLLLTPQSELKVLLREDPELPQAPQKLLRRVFSDDCVREHFHVSRILGRLPSMWTRIKNDGYVKFDAPVPAGNYKLPTSEHAVLVVDCTNEA